MSNENAVAIAERLTEALSLAKIDAAVRCHYDPDFDYSYIAYFELGPFLIDLIDEDSVYDEIEVQISENELVIAKMDKFPLAEALSELRIKLIELVKYKSSMLGKLAEAININLYTAQ